MFKSSSLVPCSNLPRQFPDLYSAARGIGKIRRYACCIRIAQIFRYPVHHAVLAATGLIGFQSVDKIIFRLSGEVWPGGLPADSLGAMAGGALGRYRLACGQSLLVPILSTLAFRTRKIRRHVLDIGIAQVLDHRGHYRVGAPSRLVRLEGCLL